MDADGGMVLLLLFLGAILTYLLFSKGFWLDKFMQKHERWDGSDVQGDIPFKINEAISQEKVPFTPSLDIPFNDPEVPNRPSKKKKPKRPKTKRVYKRRKKR